MQTTTNEYGQPVGVGLPHWTARPLPTRTAIAGRFCRVARGIERLHAADLYTAFSQAADGRDWTYMSAGPFASEADYRAHAERAAASADPLHFAVIDSSSGQAVGTLSLMRIDPANGVIEVGHVAFSPLLKRTPIATEAQYLLMRHAFDTLGYRRFEWKCDSLNAPSRQAAARLGFTFEGVFRQAVVTRGRTRDTAWFSVIDGEWPDLRDAFERWLAPENFDAEGQQRTSLAQLREHRSSTAEHKR